MNREIERWKRFLFKIILPDGELNLGLSRDRRGYSPLYYRGFDEVTMNFLMFIGDFQESWEKNEFSVENSNKSNQKKKISPTGN